MIAANDTGRGRLSATNDERQRSLLVRISDLETRYSEMRALRGDGNVSPGSSYLAGESSRMSPVPRGIDPMGSDADYHYSTERNYFLMVERGRDAVRNHPLVGQAIWRLIANLRLSQMSLDMSTGSKDADAYVKDKWRAWTCDATACDWEAARDFDDLVGQSFFNEVADGDVLHIPLRSGQLQTWESHHIRNPFGHRPTMSDQNGIVHGAEIASGRVVAYHVTPHYIPFGSSVKRGMKSQRYPVFDRQGNRVAFYSGHTHRFQQRRGISKLSAPRESMNGFDDLNYAHIKSALRRALISYLMESNQMAGPPEFGGGELPQAGDRYTTTVGLGLDTIVVEQAGEPAQVFKPPVGYSMKGWNANLPAPAFFEQASLLLTCLAVNLDLPLSFLLLDGSLVNFHGGRMTWDQVKMRLQELQRHVIGSRHRPVFMWKLRQWLTPGSDHYDEKLAAYAEQGADFNRFKFRPKGWPYPKPLEDVAANDVAERRNIYSMREIYADQGDDFDEKMPQIIDDRAAAFRYSLDAATAIVSEYPALELDTVAVASELRYGQSDPGGVQLTLSAGEKPEPEPTPGNKPGKSKDDA